MSDTYDAPEYDPEDYDTVEKVAAVAAPIFALHGYRYGGFGGDIGHVPDATEIVDVLSRLYAHHAKSASLGSVGTGRFVLVDENSHDGTPTLYEGIRVFLDLGELPPLWGNVSHAEGTA